MSGWNEGGYEVVQEQGPSEPADAPVAESLIPEIPASTDMPAEAMPEVASEVSESSSLTEVTQPEVVLDGASMEEPVDLPSATDLAAGQPEAPAEVLSGLESEEEPPAPETLVERSDEDDEVVEEESNDLPPVGVS